MNYKSGTDHVFLSSPPCEGGSEYASGGFEGKRGPSLFSGVRR
jgi:hypothetical protein